MSLLSIFINLMHPCWIKVLFLLYWYFTWYSIFSYNCQKRTWWQNSN